MEESEINDSELESEEDDDKEISIGSSDLEAQEAEEENDNPHGFVFAHNLDTFKKTKKERLAILKAE
jgi:hypothetical protein